MKYATDLIVNLLKRNHANISGWKKIRNAAFIHPARSHSQEMHHLSPAAFHNAILETLSPEPDVIPSDKQMTLRDAIKTVFYLTAIKKPPTARSKPILI